MGGGWCQEGKRVGWVLFDNGGSRWGERGWRGEGGRERGRHRLKARATDIAAACAGRAGDVGYVVAAAVRYALRLVALDSASVSCGATATQAEWTTPVTVGCPGDFDGVGASTVRTFRRS